MQSNLGRVALGAAVVLAAVLLLVVLKDDDGNDNASGGGASTVAEQTGSKSDGRKPSESSRPAIPTIAVKNGKPVGGVEELTYEAGDRIRFKVDSDASDEVHIHGYDVEEEVKAGGSALFDFPASIEGVFEAELHGSGEQIAEIRVNP